MIGLKVALLFVASQFVLTSGLANPKYILITRQGPSLPNTAACEPPCSSLENDLTTCTANATPELELSCLCGSPTVDDFNSCASCIIDSNPGSAVVSEVQSAQSEFYSACAQATPTAQASQSTAAATPPMMTPTTDAATSMMATTDAATSMMATTDAAPSMMTTTHAAPPMMTTTPLTTSVMTFRPPAQMTTPTSSPSSPSPNARNMTVSASDPSIVYHGNWTPVNSTCNSTASTVNMQSNGSGNSLGYGFTGTAIYIAIQENPNAGSYSVAVDGVVTQQNGFSAAAICQLGFEQTGLSNGQHSITVAPNVGVFELDHFIITTRADATPTSSASVCVPLTVMYAIVGVTLWTIL